jgi:hypothetical protein
MKFGRGYEMTLNHIHDTITVREGNERLKLIVSGDSMRMVAGLNKAQKKMQELTEAATDEQITDCAEFFASVIFGQEQAKKLLQFYADDPASVITVCGRYFKERLADKIAKAQKKLKP